MASPVSRLTRSAVVTQEPLGCRSSDFQSRAFLRSGQWTLVQSVEMTRCASSRDIFTVAYPRVKQSFNRILGIRRWAQLGPEVPRVIRMSAQFKTDQMVFLIEAGRCIPVTVFLNLLFLQRASTSILRVSQLLKSIACIQILCSQISSETVCVQR